MKNYKLTKLLSLLTPVIILLVIFLMGGGHGYFEPLMIIYPYASLLLIWFAEINLGFLILAIIQFPVYGYLIDNLSKKNKATIPLLIVLHIIVATIALYFRPEQFR